MQHTLKAIEPGQKRAIFADKDGFDIEIDYDYIHVIPPQRAPEVIRQSGLSWADKWTDQGWVECDQDTLRHLRYREIWALGDVAGVPKGKTAASVKWQVPVVEDGLVAAIAGTEPTERYNGYTSCPLITRVGRAMLIEFDYNNDLVPSFPGVIAPLEELWISWLMKEVALKPTYNAMLRGRPEEADEMKDLTFRNPDRGLRGDLRALAVLGHGRCRRGGRRWPISTC